MEIAAYSFGFLTLAFGTIMGIASLNSHRDVGLWFGVATIISATIGGGCWLQDYWWKGDAAIANNTPVDEQRWLERRAWVRASSATIGPLMANQHIQCEVRLTNSGETPAFMKTGDGDILPLEPDADIVKFMEAIKTHPPKAFEVELAPGTVTNVDMSDIARLTEELVKDVQSGAARLFVVGFITYTDAMNRPHETQYCFVYDPRTGKMYRHEKGNHMD